MRVLLVGMILLLSGCDNGRYQIAAPPSTEIVWRLDTRTGEVAKCIHGRDSGGPALCSAPAR